MEERIRLTPEQIDDEIHYLAKNGDDAIKKWALDRLKPKGQGVENLVLVDPLNDIEITNRLSDLMRPAGPYLCNIAFRKAFPSRRKRFEEQDPVPATFENAEIDHDKINRCRNLKSLYREYPEIKGSGFPRGFPRGHGLLAQAEWCRRKAMQMELDKVNIKRKEDADVSKFLAENEQEIQTKE